MQEQAFVPGDDPVELRPVRRSFSVSERSHVATGIRGGQGRSGADLDRAVMVMIWMLVIAAGLGLGITAARYVAAAADAIGAWCVS
jgi:hypothetical protein